MKTTVNNSQFIDAFKSIRPDNFSYEGLNALFDYFEEYEESTGEEIELDVIAICCEYTEWEDFEEFQLQHPSIESIEEISDYTFLIDIENSTRFITQDF